jgi:manganese oxidase
MNNSAPRAPVFTLWLGVAVSILGSTRAGAAEHIAPNDNRVTAGTPANGTLTVRLDTRAGVWYPDGETQPGVTVKAFALDNAPLQIPGPVIRVPEGTVVRVVLRNRLDDALAVHGLYSRSGKDGAETNPVIVPGGESRDVTFLAGRAGTYYYWAAGAAETALPNRSGVDSQLSGALIVDPPGTNPQSDRVLVIGGWNSGPPARVTRIVINGLSWPHTERLTYPVGDTVHLRLINTGVAVHPMHLHGFYFNVDSRGDEGKDATFSPSSSPHLVVTERLASGRTFALTWTPTRPGNWLFHCHDNVHLLYGGTLDGSPSPRADPHHHVENHALEAMAGPVMGITVTGAATDRTVHSDTPRRLRLIAGIDAGGSETDPAFAYALEEGAGAGAARPSLPGPTILLKRGEPVAITVVNALQEPTAVHWHGIELESYYDGVAGFAGEGTHIAPAIAPGGSFEARFTPPRSGTFIYHTHIDEVRQQAAGLYGALLVVDSPSAYDPRHDLIFMVSVPRRIADTGVVLVNGSATPPATEMRAGEHYRLRFINLHVSRPSMRMRILKDSSPLTWRAVAKDGRDLPADQAVDGPSEIQMANGETYDFDFVPIAAGELRFDVTTGGGVLLASMPIHVR